MFFAEPLPSKNPYNNLPFTKSNLYNIYFFIKFNTNIHDDLFFNFFRCDFNLSIFYNKYEHILREHSITNYIKNSTVNVLIDQINKMINIYNYRNIDNKIKIDSEFPKDKLIKIMKPYLKLYIESYYSLIPVIKRNAGFELNIKLRKFQKFNHQFGKKQAKLGFKLCPNFIKKTYIKGYEFNDKHIPFNSDINDQQFLSNHLTFTEINYYNNYTSNINQISTIELNIYDLIMNPIGMTTGTYLLEENEVIESESDNSGNETPPPNSLNNETSSDNEDDNLYDETDSNS
jgi:hypothetical protein